MNLQYGCQVTNRYTGYLDSSDCEHSANFDGKSVNKRKIKKKRNPRYRKYANKAVNTENLIETTQTSNEESDAHFASDEAETASKIDKGKTFERNDLSYAATTSDAMIQINTSIDSGKCTESTVDGQSSASDSKFIKWSDICFEEEKAMKEMEEKAMKMETQAVHPLQTDEQLEKRKSYPTTFFYNSNYRGFHRTDRHSLRNRQHSSFHKMDTPDTARMKRCLGRQPLKYSPDNN